VKDAVQEMKQVSGYDLQVLVPQAHQPHAKGKSEQAFAGLKQGNTAQPKMLHDEVFAVIHGGPRANFYFIRPIW
jgi:hypothetical protein